MMVLYPMRRYSSNHAPKPDSVPFNVANNPIPTKYVGMGVIYVKFLESTEFCHTLAFLVQVDG